ncbi:homeobox-leucine zipper family protein /lipid-binding START domain-containing protein, partial [Striga asiatica]
ITQKGGGVAATTFGLVCLELSKVSKTVHVYFMNDEALRSSLCFLVQMEKQLNSCTRIYCFSNIRKINKFYFQMYAPNTQQPSKTIYGMSCLAHQPPKSNAWGELDSRLHDEAPEKRIFQRHQILFCLFHDIIP